MVPESLGWCSVSLRVCDHLRHWRQTAQHVPLTNPAACVCLCMCWRQEACLSTLLKAYDIQASHEHKCKARNQANSRTVLVVFCTTQVSGLAFIFVWWWHTSCDAGLCHVTQVIAIATEWHMQSGLLAGSSFEKSCSLAKACKVLLLVVACQCEVE